MQIAAIPLSKVKDALSQHYREREDQHLLAWHHQPRIVFKEARGVRMRDVDGREYLDFVSGHINLLLGHSHPELMEALAEQAAKIWTHYKYYTTDATIDFAERLAESLPDGLDVLNFTTTGSEANEVAMRLARGATGRFDMVSVIQGLHGGTFAVESLTTIGGPRKRGLGPMLMPARANAVLAPYCYRCPINLTYPSCNIACLDVSDEMIERTTTGEVAAIFAETIMGSGGMVVPPEGWLPKLKRLAHKWGALLVLDEVQVSPAKTGTLWCFEQFGAQPDILTLGKGTGGGMSIGAAITSHEIADKAKEMGCGVPWGSTFVGEALDAAVARRQLEILIRDGFAQRAARLGLHFMARLNELKERHDVVGDVRGRGMYVGIEIVTDKVTKAKNNALMQRIRYNAIENGLLIGGSGNVLKIFPALIITEAELDEGVAILDRAIRLALDGHPVGIDRFSEGSHP
jgi:2,2-dialkylglycine decarboxylase (pyruvate)